MPTRTAQSCAHSVAVEALAKDELLGADREQTERHLEQCETCRALFRQLTEDRFPRFRGYTILSEIGRGGFGVVYKAFHNGKERVEALKVLFGKTPVREAYFENEVHLAAQLRHPCIATLYEAHLSTPPLYYSMEYVAGRHLDRYLRDEQVSLEQRIELVKAVAQAVDYAHRKGVIHRDIKPQNILIDPEGQPRVVDFGISKRLSLDADAAPPAAAVEPEPARREGAMGTYGYMAPEQMAGLDVDARSDVYGLGALLFHVITGEPASLATNSEALVRVLRERRVSRAGDLAAIIARCVQQAPEQRYATCAALADDLDHYLTGREVDALPNPTPGYHLARMTALLLRHYPRPLQAAATMLVVLLLVAVFYGTCARWLVAGQGQVETAMIAVKPSTLTAMQAGRIGADLPGFSPANKRSWRLLYGQLMERLAVAHPRVVAFDYYFPKCAPEYDAALLRGIAAVEAPVVFGAAAYDVNANPEVCPALRDAIHSCGGLWMTSPDYLENEINVPLAIVRGYNAPVPSLALAAFAAARFPDCDLEAHVRPNDLELELRYRKQHVARGEYRYRSGETDHLPLVGVTDVGQGRSVLEAEDRVAQSRFRLAGVQAWRTRAIPLEDVLRADDEHLRAWFLGKAIVVGQMLPPFDQHMLTSDEAVFGVQFQALVLDSLLARTSIYCLDRRDLVLRVCLWCVLGALLAGLVPVRSSWSPRVVLAFSGTVFLLALALAVQFSMQVTSAVAVEATIAGCALLATGAVVVLLQTLHRRQWHLTPIPVWNAGRTGGSTTIAVSPRESSS